MDIKEALERTKTVNEAIKMLDELRFNRTIYDIWFKERTGEIYDKLITPDKWIVKAQKGDFELTYTTTYTLEKPFEETAEELKKKSLNSRIIRVRRQIRREINKKLKATFINEYQSKLYLLFEDGTAKELRIRENTITSRECHTIEDVIITGDMSIENNKVFYTVIGKNESILKIAKEINGIFKVNIIPIVEYEKKIRDIIISTMDIPELIKPMLIEYGFTPYVNDGMKKNDTRITWTKQYITIITKEKWERLKFTSPNFEQKFKKKLIEISVK
jgi:hypothetical protein